MRALAALATAALLATGAESALAHGGGQDISTMNAPLLIAGIALLGAGIGLRALGKGHPRIPGSLLTVGVVLSVGAFIFQRTDHVEATATIRFVQPVNGATVPAGKPVTLEVAVANGRVATSPTDTEGGHLHLYVDGELQQMPYGSSTKIDLPKGSHDLKMEFVDANHISFTPPVQTTIQVRAA